MVRYTRATTAEAVQKIHHLRTNPPAYEGNQRVNLRWVDELGFEWASNFTCFNLALDFIGAPTTVRINGNVEKTTIDVVAMNAEWY